MAQWIVLGTLLAALVLFVSDRLRYDVVALLALLAVTITGVVPQDQAFAGFGHPAVITVAAVLAVSRGLLNAGIVDMISKWVARAGDQLSRQMLVLVAVVIFASGFMNNVGALALLMPVAIRLARRNGGSPSPMLMPLAFGSLLGGMTTLIGTPPNIIIATFRGQVAGEPFRMFDFTPVGLAVAVTGGAFLALIGWRLVPHRQGQGTREDLFEIEHYTTEVRVPEKSPLVGRSVRQIRQDDLDILIVALLRGEQRIPAPSAYEIIRADDVLMVEADPEELKELVDTYGLALVGSGSRKHLDHKEVSIVEAIVTPSSPILNQTPESLNMRWRYGVNLLAISRKGTRVSARLRDARFRAGDVLLLQTPTNTLAEVLATLGCLPLAEREINLAKPRPLALTLGIFGGALLLAAVGVLAISVAMIGAVVLMLLTGILTLRETYESIDWPIIVLLGAMIPVGAALETSGAAQSIADLLLALGGQLPPVVTLTVVLVGTMCLSDIINNAASAVLMAPIAISTAQGLGVSADPFLLAVGIGASCAFLTPIGHQSNTLVMGPGGYRFGDYWRVGLPLQILILVVTIPLLLLFWPL